jgi:hypothetical protein
MLPLFSQINQNVGASLDPRNMSSYGSLLGFVFSLVRSSLDIRRQMLKINGFLVLSYLLEQVRPQSQPFHSQPSRFITSSSMSS